MLSQTVDPNGCWLPRDEADDNRQAGLALFSSYHPRGASQSCSAIDAGITLRNLFPCGYFDLLENKKNITLSASSITLMATIPGVTYIGPKWNE